MLVSIPRDVVLKMDPEMQALIGYEASGQHRRLRLSDRNKLTMIGRISLWVRRLQEPDGKSNQSVEPNLTHSLADNHFLGYRAGKALLSDSGGILKRKRSCLLLTDNKMLRDIDLRLLLAEHANFESVGLTSRILLSNMVQQLPLISTTNIHRGLRTVQQRCHLIENIIQRGWASVDRQLN